MPIITLLDIELMQQDVAKPGKLVSGLIFLVFACGVVLRVPGAFSDFWLDEIWALQAAQKMKSLADIWALSSFDGHRTLYQAFLYLLPDTQSYWIYRIPSLIFGLACFPLVMAVTNKSDRVSRLFACMFVSLSFVFVVYSTEARGYSGLMLCTLASIYYTQNWLAGSRQSFERKLPVIVACGVLFQPIFIQFYFALLAWSVVDILSQYKVRAQTVEQVRNELRNLHALPLAIVVGLGLLIFSGLHEGGGQRSPYAQTLLETISISYGFYTVDNFASNEGLFLSAKLVSLLIVSLCAWQILRLKRQNDHQWALYLLGIFIIPLLAIIALRPPSLFPRYFIPSIILSYLLIARSFAELLRSKKVISCGFVVLFMSGFVFGSIRQGQIFAQFGRGQYQQAIEYMVANSEGPVVNIMGEHDFRNEMMLTYYASYVPGAEKIHYFRPAKAKELNVKPDWYLVHSLDYGQSASPKLQVGDREFKLVKISMYSGLSGWTWLIYRAAS